MQNPINYEVRALTEVETLHLIEEISQIPDITYIGKFVFRHLKNTLVATKNSELCGICSFVPLGGNWVKLGPLVVLKKFRGKGIGSTLLRKVGDINSEKNIYVGSSRNSLKSLNKSFGFHEVSSFWKLPFRVKLFFSIYFVVNFSPKFVWETIRKYRNFPKRDYKHFVKR